MPAFAVSLRELIAPLDPVRHAIEITRLKPLKSLDDLQRVSKENNGFLTPGTIDPRLRLVQHNVRIFLVVEYKEGWTTRISMASF